MQKTGEMLGDYTPRGKAGKRSAEKIHHKFQCKVYFFYWHFSSILYGNDSIYITIERRGNTIFLSNNLRVF
jgi:hypothetical protein